MKRRLALLFLFVLVSGCAAEDFWAQLTPDERAAAGLADLTPEQRTALDRLAGRYAGKAVAGVRAEVKEKKAANAGLALRDDDEPLRTRIAGEFRGWDGTTTFRFENGQVWQQVASSEKFWSAAQAGPEVELRPSKIGGWKLFVPSVDRWVRIKRVR